MKVFKNAHPFLTEDKIPDNISECLSKHSHLNLKEGMKSCSGFALLTEKEHFIRADHLWLFKYISESRKANAHSVEMLYQERLQKATDDGRIIEAETALEIHEQAAREILKYAPIIVSEVFILFDEKSGYVWCSGSTSAKCEKALSRLRRAIGTLKTVPQVFDIAGKALARYLSHDAYNPLGVYSLPDTLRIPDYGKAVAVGIDGQKAIFSGLNLASTDLRSMLSDMEVRTLEMCLVKRDPDGQFTEQATFELNTTSSSTVHIKGLSYQGASADVDGDSSHHYTTEIFIISRILAEILSGLRGLLG